MKLKTNLLPLLIAVLIATCSLTSITADAKQQRSEAAKNHFKAAHPCPANGNTRGSCPGFVIDHVKPLCSGGADSIENMAWQPLKESRLKDIQERAQCREMRKAGL